MARKLILIPGSIRRSLRRPHPTTMDGLGRSHLRTCELVILMLKNHEKSLWNQVGKGVRATVY